MRGQPGCTPSSGFTSSLLTVFLVACTSLTPQPTGYVKADPLWASRYGYSDKPIGGDEFSVVATGNSLTLKERVAEIALLRAAHLTQEQGKTHFVLLKDKTQTLSAEAPILLNLSLSGATALVPIGTRTSQETTAILLIRVLPLAASYPPDAIDAVQTIAGFAQRLE